MFSTEPICYLGINKFEGMHEIVPEIEEKILERDRQHNESHVEKEESEVHEIEHTYMDFKNLIIGEKIQVMEDSDELEKLAFNDEYFSNLFF